MYRNQQQVEPDDIMDGELTTEEIRRYISKLTQPKNRKE
jgi:hypothetical protein